MIVECCGKDRNSRFCPDCGATLIEDDPIAWLLAHCRKQEKVARTRAANERDAGESVPDPGEGPSAAAQWRQLCSGRAEGFEAKAAAWKARGDALAATVRGEGER